MNTDMTTKKDKALLSALKTVRSEVAMGMHKDSAICHAVDDVLGRTLSSSDSYDVRTCLYDLFTNWPEHSGNRWYPIGPKKWSQQCVDMWDNALRYETFWDTTIEYGQARYRLLDWSIEELEPVINEDKV
jgi:hypothetical protein